MKIKSKRLLSTLLAVMMVFGLFAVMPATASAANIVVNILPSDSVSTIQTDIQSAIDTAGNGDIVTVGGSKNNVTGTEILELTIPSGVTVSWAASYAGASNVSGKGMIELKGQGIFEVATNGTIEKTSGTSYTIHTSGSASADAVTIRINGGTVSCSSMATIYSERGNVEVLGGLIENTANSRCIQIGYGTGKSVTVSGGTVRSAGGKTIYSYNSKSPIITISGGIVENTDAGPAIAVENSEYSVVNVSGGTVSAESGDAIHTIGDGYGIMISGSAVVSSKASRAVYAVGKNSSVVVSGGTLEARGAESSHAVCTDGTGATIDISGGLLTSVGTNGTIRSTGTSSYVNVSGGFVFAYGTSTSGSGSGTAISMETGAPTISGSAVICAWAKPSGATTYTGGTSDNLTVNPTAATATWGKSGSQSGINYANGANTGFFAISDVTVTGTVVTPTPTPTPTPAAGVTITPTAASFVKNSGVDIPVTVDFAGNTLQGINNGSYTLQSGTDFTLSGNIVTLKTAYLNTLATGTHTLAFAFSGGTNPTLTITVTETLPTDPMLNFTEVNTYTRGQFADVNEAQWYGFDAQRVIATAYKYGLMLGTSDTLFEPTGNVTIAQAITMAARVHKIYMTGNGDFVQGSIWYQVYVDYAVANNIIATNDFTDYNKSATRAEMAFIFSRALPAAEFASQNTVNFLPDVNSGTPYRDAILTLYTAGVLAGNDTQGTFHPSDNITRAEASAIISRVILPATRFSGKTFG